MKPSQHIFKNSPFGGVLIAIVICFFSTASFAQKIMLKDHTYIQDAKFNAIRNNAIEYFKDGSLHDIEVSKVLWVEKADGGKMFFDDNTATNSAIKQDSIMAKPTTVKEISTENTNNKTYFDSVAFYEQKRALRKAAYEKELERRRKGGRVIMPAAENDSTYSTQIDYSNGLVNHDYKIGYKEGKIYMSRVPRKDIPFPMDVNKLPIPEYYKNNYDYKRGFVNGIYAKQNQKSVAAVVVIGGALALTTLIVYTLYCANLLPISH
jgi:hypothetical protein